MSTERWQRLEEIFVEGRRLPADQRVEFVARACGPDEALRDEVLCLCQPMMRRRSSWPDPH